MANIYIKKPNGEKERIAIKTHEEEAKEAKDLIAKIKEHPEQPLKELINSDQALALETYFFAYASEEEKKELEPFLEDIFSLTPSESKLGVLQGLQDSYNLIQASMGAMLTDQFKDEDFLKDYREIYQKTLADLEAIEIPRDAITAMERLTEQWREAAEEMKIQTDKTIDAIKENFELSFSPPGSWLTLSKVVSELKKVVDEKLEKDPYLVIFQEEIEKMKTDPEWAGVDLSYLTYDEVQKEQDLFTATPHNRAITEAARRAEERLKAQQEEENQQPELFEVVEKPEAEGEPLTKVETLEEGKPLTKQIHVTSLIQNALVVANIINLNKVKIPTGIGKTRGGITDTLVVEIPKEARFEGITSLTGYEREVSNALYTLYHLGYRAFTPTTVYKALTMQDRIPDKGTEEELIETLDKLSMVKVTLEASEEIRKYSKDPKAIYERTDYYFPLYKEKVILYGQEATLYHFRGEKPPILLEHAQKTNKIATFRKELLLTRDEKGHVLNKNNNRTAINGYILRRLHQMKDPNTGEKKATQNNRINFDNMFKDLQIVSNNRAQTQRNRENAFLILDHLQRAGEFKRYAVVKGGRGGAVLGVDIFF